MTKRFTRCKDECKVKVYDEVTQEIIPSQRVVELMNELYEKNKNGKEYYRKLLEKYDKLKEENEKLKQREENLLSEIDDFQELLSKKDSVCHKRVINLIDDRIFNFSNVRTELLLHSDDDYRLEKLSFTIQNLRELKKELCE